MSGPCYLAGTDRFFIHIPKNAGTAIVKQIGSCETGHHISIRNIAPQFRNKALAVVRNPYDRVISLYEYCKSLNSYWHNKENPPPLYDFCTTHSFEEFVIELCNGTFDNKDWHFLPQWHWILDENKKVACEYVKFENLEEDLSKILGKKITLEKINNTKRDKKIYYNKNLKELVYKKFKADFELFYN